MTPSYDELLRGVTTWNGKHLGVGFVISNHGHRRGDEYLSATPHPGTWCYYLLIPKPMFPHRWKDFACVRNKSGFLEHGPAFTNDMFDSEITWASSEPYYSRKEKRMFDLSKVGCDYGHLWHAENGYPDNFQSVRRDAIQTAEKFIRVNPDGRWRSEYSGKWDKPSKFLRTKKGTLVHVTDAIPETWRS